MAKKTDFKVFVEAELFRALFVPGGEVFTRKEIDEEFTDKAKRIGAKGWLGLNLKIITFEGGVTKFFTSEQLAELKNLLAIG